LRTAAKMQHLMVRFHHAFFFCYAPPSDLMCPFLFSPCCSE
jgi:hypothetical protein